MDIAFDEFNLDMVITDDGRPLDFSAEKSTIADIETNDEALYRLSIEIIRRTVDRMKCEGKQGKTILHFHLDH